MWLCIGAFTLQRKHPTFPPLSTDGCAALNNLTLFYSADVNSSSIVDLFSESSINTTMTYHQPQTNQTIEVTSFSANNGLLVESLNDIVIVNSRFLHRRQKQSRGNQIFRGAYPKRYHFGYGVKIQRVRPRTLLGAGGNSPLIFGKTQFF